MPGRSLTGSSSLETGQDEVGRVIGDRVPSAGWPDSRRDMSGAGPWAVMAFGEWQSSQPVMVTRCAPHSTWLA